MLSFSTQTPPKKASYRHVVFVDPAHPPRMPVNFSPPQIDQPRSLGSLTPQEFSFITWLFNRAGLRIRQYRQETLARRLPACLRMVHARSIHEARAALEANPSLVSAA
ncbi:MAG TPA: hypothetical protein VKK61_11310, partial [Tepidisphaeraceae bacterium]|nr:hypothetical protein [Tepidisphaeraceae bacterium]